MGLFPKNTGALVLRVRGVEGEGRLYLVGAPSLRVKSSWLLNYECTLEVGGGTWNYG